MAGTIVEKILGAHSGKEVHPGDIADVQIDVRIARDFGGANVVKNMREHGLSVDDPKRTFFTFDCNPGGSDQKYAANQQTCRLFAREHGVQVFDIDAGIGTHVAIDEGLATPGSTLISTDSHANILGAIGAFGQGMGDVDIAQAFAHGRVWFKVPPTIRIELKGMPSPSATPKDLTLAVIAEMGANGLLGYAAEYYGPAVDALGLAGRVTMASMATEMGGIIGIFPPNDEVLAHCSRASGHEVTAVTADADAEYARVVEIDVDGLGPLAARPGRPDDVVAVASVAGTKIGSAFIGSCTGGRFEDLRAAADVLRGRHVAPGVVLKIVPSTDRVWRRCLDEGVFETFKAAGALVGNAGCAGCAAGQIGQNGPKEVTVSSGNRNFPGKQGHGEVYLTSPEVAAASAVAGMIATPDTIPDAPALFETATAGSGGAAGGGSTTDTGESADANVRPERVTGRVWFIGEDNIDTDMIYHNRHLAVTDIAEMGQYTFGNLAGWEDFSEKAKPGDIVVTGKNFGCGSSRQQAVDCFESLGVSLLIAESYGAIYERNAINSGFPILSAALAGTDIANGEIIEVNLETGKILRADGGEVTGRPFAEVQMQIYQRGGLLVG